MAHQTPDFYEPTYSLIVPAHTVVSVGDYVDGYGIQPGTTVFSVKSYGGGKLKITLNKKPWTGNTPPSGITQGGGAGDEWWLDVTFSNFKIDGVYSESKDTTVSFREVGLVLNHLFRNLELVVLMNIIRLLMVNYLSII